jgi:hypothetical protein
MFAETSRFQTLRYRWHDPPYDLIVDLDHGKRGLCDLRSDPKCTHTILGDNKDIAAGMFTDMMDWLGTPWEANSAGTVRVDHGVLYDGNKRERKDMRVKKGDRFAVHPLDAKVTFTGKNGKEKGPWTALGGKLPGEKDPVTFHGRRGQNTTVDLSDSEKEMLEALGYIQD